MKKERMLELKEEYPEILAELGGDSMKTCMSFGHGGLAIGPGWDDILVILMNMIQGHIKSQNRAFDNGYPHAPAERVKPVVFKQVKEKFGTLTIYAQGGNDVTHAYISFASIMSGSICETCGEKGKMRTDGWIVCKCDHCFENKITAE